MRSVLLSLGLAIGALIPMVVPPPARADDFRTTAAITSAATAPARHWYGYGGYWGGRAFYPRYGYYRGYYPGFYRGYYPGFYRGYYYGGWTTPYYYGGGPYTSYYYGPGAYYWGW